MEDLHLKLLVVTLNIWWCSFVSPVHLLIGRYPALLPCSDDPDQHIRLVLHTTEKEKVEECKYLCNLHLLPRLPCYSRPHPYESELSRVRDGCICNGNGGNSPSNNKLQISSPATYPPLRGTTTLVPGRYWLSRRFWRSEGIGWGVLNSNSLSGQITSTWNTTNQTDGRWALFLNSLNFTLLFDPGSMTLSLSLKNPQTFCRPHVLMGLLLGEFRSRVGTLIRISLSFRVAPQQCCLFPHLSPLRSFIGPTSLSLPVICGLARQERRNGSGSLPWIENKLLCQASYVMSSSSSLQTLPPPWIIDGDPTFMVIHSCWNILLGTIWLQSASTD